ncbi:hypothetical protein HanXRQr2_Chr11g0517041 [Helianthus annuus]|uniref:Uncharacterized protein n=1 Tax=Helianthus annuus TaxID=4232 RepID=A0A9K3HTY2_HELAN|nr:hypothetical protein HanXRQr2_Chr11g0517041 [Helianthus annuus]KAJ0877293.1 hypothetical protein HanPSC8_Chr11g0498401 [Helianthus annuus]
MRPLTKEGLFKKDSLSMKGTQSCGLMVSNGWVGREPLCVLNLFRFIMANARALSHVVPDFG